jgi:predicted ATPase
MIGINGSGKSNLLRALNLIREGVFQKRLKDYIFNTMGGIDNILFKSPQRNDTEICAIIKYTFDCEKVEKKNYKINNDIIYEIKLIKSPSSLNYYVSEKVYTNDGFSYLDFNSGSGYLAETSDEPVKAITTINYLDFVSPQELALSQIFDDRRYPLLSNLRNAISEIVVYHSFDTTFHSQLRKPSLPTSEKRLLSLGANLAQVINTIKINNKSDYNRIIEYLKEVNPFFSEIDFNFIGGNIELMLSEVGLEGSIHVSNISDGTLHYLCLLSILLNNNRGRLVCIDEPETGLHPDMLDGISSLLKEKGSETQFIISTHSDNLLNKFGVDDILVFEKGLSNSSIVGKFKEEDFSGWYSEFFPGKMWRMGDLGGNRW